MKGRVLGAALLLASVHTCAAAAGGAAVTPVEKVLQLMAGMLEKGMKEKHEEQVQYAAYKQWCDDTAAATKQKIAEADEQIEILKADIQKYEVDIATLTKEIAKLQTDIVAWEGDIVAATKVRKIEKADYDKLSTDYAESIDALKRAIAVLKAQAFDREQSNKTVGEFGKVSMTQVSSVKGLRLIPAEAKRAIDAFLAEDPSPLDVTAPEANAYEFQSQSVIDMLEKLLGEFKDKLDTLMKEEVASVQAFEMLILDLKAQIGYAEEDITEKTTIKAKLAEKMAIAKADLEDTTAQRDADQKYLDDLLATCESKAKDFQCRQELRAGEIEAIKKAMEIISSGTVQGNAEKHLSTLTLMQSKNGALAQLRADARSPSQLQVAQFLQDKAGELDSRLLSALAVRVSEDPFKKVKKMIKDLIVKLMEEAHEEAEHKGWCDTELATNEHTRKEKTLAVETLQSEIDGLVASIAKLTEEIAELTQAVADLDAAMAKATELREAEKAKNAETIKDASEAEAAVVQAITVLQEYYSKEVPAAALLQQPEIFEDGCEIRQKGASGGVLSMLEVIQSDFARLAAETEAAEVAAQKAYETFMSDSKIDKSAKETDIKNKTTQKGNEEEELVMKKKDLEGTQKELDAALRYYDKLKPSCVMTNISYEERVKRRKEEIESLQEALKILNGKEIDGNI